MKPIRSITRAAGGVLLTTLLATACDSRPEAVTGIAPGTSESTAMAPAGGVTLDVSPQTAVASVSITPDPVRVAVGGALSLAIEARDASGAVMHGLTATVSSSNAAIASVSAEGRVTGIAAGTATLAATVGGVSATVPVHVHTVATLAISPSPVRVRAGARAALEVTARDAGGTVIPGVRAAFNSSDENVAVVSDGGTITGVAPGTAEVTARAGGVTARVTVTVAPASPVGTVTISPSPVRLRPGSRATLTVTARDAGGAVVPGSRAVFSSSNESVVQVSDGGTVTGVAPGTAQVTATVQGVSAQVPVTVTPAVATVTISPSPIRLRPGARSLLTVTARDASGTEIPQGRATFSSSNDNVAVVSDGGTVTGVAPGTAQVTATVGGVSAQVTVTVSMPVATLTISPSPVAVRVGARVGLTVSAWNGRGAQLRGVRPEFSSSNENVAVVSDGGTVTGVAPGTAQITATAGGASARVTVTVLRPVATVTISPSPLTVRMGERAMLSVTARDANGTVVSGVTPAFSSSDGGIVRVTPSGTVIPVAPGTAQVTARVAGVTAHVTVTVTPAVATVTISPSPVSVRVGSTAALTVTARDAGGAIIPGVAATFFSSNVNVARVNASGIITGVGPGTAQVTATVAGVTARVTVTVTRDVVTVVISPSPLTLAAGVTLPLTITALDGNGLPILGLLASLSTSDPSVARVNANGTITGIAAGTAEVTATVLGISARVTVTVTGPGVAVVEVTPSTLTLRVGELQRLAIAPRDASGRLLTGLTAVLSSSNPAVALVAPDGTVTGLLPGTAEIRVTVGGVTTPVPVRVTL